MSLADIQQPNSQKLTVSQATGSVVASSGVIKDGGSPGVSVAIGTSALSALGTSGGNSNIAVGTNALKNITGGSASNNVAFGKNVGMTAGNISYVGNTMIGYQDSQAESGTGSSYSCSAGYMSQYNVQSSGYLTTLGAQTLGSAVTNVSNNVAIGYSALYGTTAGQYQTSVGYNSMLNTTGNNNTGVGPTSINYLQSGTSNTCIGPGAGNNMTTTESNNILIGSNGLVGVSNIVKIGETQQTSFYCPAMNLNITATLPLQITTGYQLGNPSAFFFMADEKAKKTLKTVDKYTTSKLHKLSVIEFDWREISKGKGVGCLAEQMELYYPEICNYHPESGKLIGIDYIKLLPLIKAEITYQKARLFEVKRLRGVSKS